MRFPSNLYQVNTATGQATGRRVQGASGVVGIAFSGDGTLYGLTAYDGFTGNALYGIDPVTAIATLVGPTGLPGIEKGDMAFDPVTRTLYGIEEVPSPGIMDMFTIDLVTGHATTIGSVDTGSFSPGQRHELIEAPESGQGTGAAINTLDLTGALLGYSAGIAFDPQTGTAYIADGNFRGSNTLYTLNTSTAC
jgi:DNA-binding beta-propeller fold protein YncE